MKITAVVSLVFLAALAAFAQQSAMTFTYQIDGAVPPAQSFQVTSNNPNYQIPYLMVTASPNAWLLASLSGTTTPAVVTVSLLQIGVNSLAPGTYAGDVQVTSFVSSTGIDVPISLTITAAAPRLSLSASGFVFNAVENGPAPPTQTLVVGASNSGVGVFSTLTTPQPNWLTLYNPTPNNPTAPWNGAGQAPLTLTVAINQTGLAPGTYSYTIPFSSAQGSNVTVNVTLVVAAPALAVNTNQLQFQCSAGLASTPPQTIQAQSTSGGALNASVAVSVPWLTASVPSGTTPFNLSIQADCGALAVGTYTTNVVISDTSYTDSQTINVVLTVGQPIASIANVTNAALPGLDNPPSTVTLAPRSMATIFGSNLADSIVVSSAPWTTPLGGTEIHLATDTCFDASCDVIANLIYVSPAQINFLVPDTAATAAVPYRIVLLRDGQRIDDQSYLLGGPGRVIIDPTGAADSSVVFEVGYDCLFSASLSDPSACGLSWTNGQDRAPVGAVTDAVTGQLITSQNPVYQGRLITLWMTALRGGVALDSQTGLETGKNTVPVGFGVAQLGQDIEGTLGVQAPSAPDTPSIPIGTFMSPTPLWAGESPQYEGLDQINVAFPTCTNVAAATSEKRYDAFLTYTSPATGTTSRIYLPFDVRVGDPDCKWVNTKTATGIVLTSSPNPSIVGQATVLTATVSPSTATGVVTFFDGNTMLGSQALSGGVAALPVSTLTIGTHSITVVYNGDNNYIGSSGAYTQTVSPPPPAATTVAVTANLNPSIFSRSVTFTATVSPSAATGTVTFLDGGASLGNSTVSNGAASLSVATLSVGNHTITAAYGGNASHASSTSAALTETITPRTSMTAISLSAQLIPWGASVTLTATVSPSNATGTVTFFDGALAGCNATDVALATVALSGGSATFSATMVCTGVTCSPNYSVCSGGGPHRLWAVYSGDVDTMSTTSSQVSLWVSATATTISYVGNQDPSSNTNPTPGPLFTATVTPSAATGYVVFSYMTATGNISLPCNGIGDIPVTNGQAVCNATPGLFPGPGSYPIVATFYPQTDQYGSSTSYLGISQVVTP